MESRQKNQAVLTASALLSLFGPSSGFPNPDDSNPPGPWGPVMRRAGERVAASLGPSPDPWGGEPEHWRAAYAKALAQEVVDRVILMQQVADALPQTGSAHGIIIIGGALADFTDGCGTGRISQRHVPRPPHHNDDGRLTPYQLTLMAAEFKQSANQASSEGLRQEFNKTAEQLLEIGMGRLQSAAAQAAG